ncbi:hypothetical protein F52700_9701 [Fusarium sp. NRRL 52700]|nr:hypothetical protein F52700_9701 [Fusarium sp. NRRL 52700]
MDCFSKLPPELRIRIFSQFSSTSTIFRLMQASPIMFHQYRESKTTIRRHFVINLLTGDRYEDLLQDALGLLYLDPANHRPDNHAMKYIIRQWISKTLPNPFKEKDQATIAKLYKLFSSMSMFVEDYISKATSSNPPQAHLCLPQIADPSKGLYYKAHSFSPTHVTLDELTSPECHFLIWAFIKYDLVYKLEEPKAASLMDDNEHSAISKEFGAATNCEREAIRCVLQYVDDVYGALFTVSTRCSTRHTSSALQDKSANPVRLLYPDNLFFNPVRAFENMELSPQYPPIMLGRTYNGSDLGLDLLRDLVLFANAAQPEDMRSWFYTMLSRWQRSHHLQPRNYRFPFLKRCWISLSNYRDGPLRSLLVQRLSPPGSACSIFTIPPSSVQRNIFRQRAWVFWDNARLFRDGLCHFLTIEELEKQSTNAYGVETTLEFQERQRLRLLQLCQYRREAGIEDTESEAQEYIFEANDEDSIPRLFDTSDNRDVTTFWQHM